MSASAWLTSAINLGKDLVSLLRDGALLVLAVLLLIFPTHFNSLLVDAGFEEGSVVGFKWKSKLVESNQALEEARGTIATLQAQNAELLKTLGEADAKADDPELKQRLVTLKQENRELADTTRQVQSIVSSTIESNSPFVQKALAATEARAPVVRSKADYSVGLQTLGVEDADRVSLNGKLQADGYGLDPITWSYPAGTRPAWFAARSTVFYYSSASKAQAEQLASLLQSLTGQAFAVQRGAGLGVEPARREVTLFVHYIKA